MIKKPFALLPFLNLPPPNYKQEVTICAFQRLDKTREHRCISLPFRFLQKWVMNKNVYERGISAAKW